MECEVLKDQFEHVQLDVAFATRPFGPKKATQLGDGGLWRKGRVFKDTRIIVAVSIGIWPVETCKESHT